MNNKSMHVRARLSGTTTQQMVHAPQNATFVWCSSSLHYPKQIAKACGREDLKIVEIGLFRDPARWYGLLSTTFVLDHSIREQGLISYETLKAILGHGHQVI